MVLLKNAIRHRGQKNITDTPLGPALTEKSWTPIPDKQAFSRFMMSHEAVSLPFWKSSYSKVY